MYYFLYQLTNKINNKIYIGVHKTTDINDGYMGSGTYLKNAIKKYGLKNFEKTILEEFDNQTDMFTRESEIVNEEFLSRSDVYNLTLGGFGSFYYANLNISKEEYSRRGKIGSENSQNTRFKSGDVRTINNAVKGGIIARDRGLIPSWVGKTHSEKTKKLIGDSNSKHQTGSGNSQYGTRWITNEVESKKISKTDDIPVGWRLGRKISKS
jgi:hypothetical protein